MARERLTEGERDSLSEQLQRIQFTAWFEKAGRAWLHALDHACANKKEESKYCVQPDGTNDDDDDGVCVLSSI